MFDFTLGCELQLEDFNKQKMNVERICDQLNEIRKKIEIRKLKLSKYCEKMKNENRICKEKVDEIDKKISDVFGEKNDVTGEYSNLDSKDLKHLNEMKDKIKGIEDSVESVDCYVDECCLENKNIYKDDLAVAQNRLEKFKRNLDLRILDLKKVQDDQDRFRITAEKIRNFVDLKSKQLQKNKLSKKIERQLSEANKCCLEIEREERELYSPIQRAKSILNKGTVDDVDGFQKEVDEVTSLWESFENEAKQVQDELACKYNEKQEVVEELNNLNEMLNNIQKGIKNFTVSDLMSLVECEEEIGDLYDGFEKRQNKIKGIIDRADKLCSKLLEEDVDEISAIASKSKIVNNQIKCELQEKMHALESVAKRLNVLKNMADDKEVFLIALCDRIKNINGQEMSFKDMMDDYEKIELTSNEVEKETRAVIENLRNIKAELPESESDQCDEINTRLEERLTGLQELAKLHHEEIKELENKEKESVSELKTIQQRLLQFQENLFTQNESEDVDMMEENMLEKERTFERVVNKIEEIKNDLLTSENNCLEYSSDFNDSLCDVIGLKEEIEKGLDSERSKVKNMRSKVISATEGKVELENEILRALDNLKEIESGVSVTADEIGLEERVEGFLKVKEKLENVDKKLSEKLEDCQVRLLSNGSQEEIEQQMEMFHERANLIRKSIDSQLSYLEDKVSVKQKTQSDLDQCLKEIEEMEKSSPSLNEKQLELMAERLEDLMNERSILRNVLEVTEDEGFSLMIDDAKDRLAVLQSKIFVTIDEEKRESGNEINENIVDEGIIQPQSDSYFETENDAEFNTSRETENAVMVGNNKIESKPEELKQGSKDGLEELGKLRERINTHSGNIRNVDEINIGLSNEKSLQNCIEAISHCLETVSFVLNDIPDLCMKLDEHSKQGSSNSEVSELLNDVQSLEEICNVTRDNLNLKSEKFADLISDSTKYKDTLKELNEKLQRATRKIAEEASNSWDDLALGESEEAMDMAKTILAEGIENLLQNLPLNEKKVLMQTQSELKERLHEAEIACARQKNVSKIKDAILKLESLEVVLDKRAKEVNEIKSCETTVDSIENLEKIINSAVEAKSEAMVIKSNIEKEIDDIPAELNKQLKDVSESIDKSIGKLEAETGDVMKSKRVVLQVEDEMSKLKSVMEKVDQRCDTILNEDDLVTVIGELSDSIQEIMHVTEQVPAIYEVLSSAANDIKPEEFANLKEKLDSVASKTLEIQQKLNLSSEKCEVAEKSKEDLHGALEEMQSEMEEIDGKIEIMAEIDDINELQDLLKFREFRLQEMGDDLKKKFDDFQECSKGLHFNAEVEMGNEVENARQKIGECSGKLMEMKKWVKMINDVTNDVEDDGRMNKVLSTDFSDLENEMELDEEQASIRVASLNKSVDKLSICEERIKEIENGEDYQKLLKERNDVVSQAVQKLTEKMKKQIMDTKDENLKRLSFEKEKLSLLNISKNIADDENSLNEVLSFAERNLQVDDREKEMIAAKEHVENIEKMQDEISKHLESLESDYVLDSCKAKLAEKLENIGDNLCKAKEKVMEKYEQLEDANKLVLKRNECLRDIKQEVKTIEPVEECDDNLNAKICNLETKQKLIASLKDQLKEIATQESNLLEILPEDEIHRLKVETEETRKIMDDLESAVIMKIKTTEKMIALKTKIDEMKKLNEELNGLCSNLESEKMIAEPSVFVNFAESIDEINHDDELELLKDKKTVMHKDLLEELKKETEKAKILIVKAEKSNEELVEGKKELEELKSKMKNFDEMENKECFGKGNIVQQIDFTENDLELKKGTLKETDMMIERLETISETIPRQDYDEMKREILEMNEKCKKDIEKDLEKIEKLSDVNNRFLMLKEKARNMMSTDFEFADLLSCSSKDLEDAIKRTDDNRAKLNAEKDEFMQNVTNLEDGFQLSEEEKAEIMEIKREIGEKSDSLEKEIEAKKSSYESKRRILEKLADVENDCNAFSKELEKNSALMIMRPFYVN